MSEDSPSVMTKILEVRIRSPIELLGMLSDLYPWKRCEPPIPLAMI